jgi:MinD-like ATPase involved in chromosome partitioning or flagellar assembly
LGRLAFEPSGVPSDVEFGSASRRLGGVNVLTGPWDSFQAWSAIASPRVRWVEHVGRLDGVVVADVGSLRGGQGPAWSIIERSEVLVMVTNPEPAALTSTVAWMDAKGQSAPGVGGLSADQARLLVVDAPTTSGERFTPDVAGELDGRLVGWWPWEPKVVDHVHRGGSLEHRAVRKFTLVRSIAATLVGLDTGIGVV